MEVRPVDLRHTGEIERAVTALGQAGNGGLIVTANGLATINRELIIKLAARHMLPAVYARRLFVTDGGLISYGSDSGQLRRSHPEGRETGRPAGAGADQVRAGDQPQDRQGPRPHGAGTVLARADEMIE